MRFFKDFFFGLNIYGKSLSFILKNRLAYFFIFPLIAYILLYIFGYKGYTNFIEYVQESATGYFDSFNFTFWGASIIKAVLSWVIGFFLKILFFFIFLYLGGYIVIIVLSPVFSMLSEKTEKILTGKEYDFEFKQFLKDILRGVGLALRNFLFEIGIIIIMFFVSFIPLINLAVPIVLFFVAAYFYGFSFLDYALERKRLKIGASAKFVRQHKALAIANGTVFSLCIMIPWIGVFLSGFVAVISVVAGTLIVHEVWKEDKLEK